MRSLVCPDSIVCGAGLTFQPLLNFLNWSFCQLYQHHVSHLRACVLLLQMLLRGQIGPVTKFVRFGFLKQSVPRTSWCSGKRRLSPIYQMAVLGSFPPTCSNINQGMGSAVNWASVSAQISLSAHSFVSAHIFLSKYGGPSIPAPNISSSHKVSPITSLCQASIKHQVTKCITPWIIIHLCSFNRNIVISYSGILWLL